jgi:hypothetical protein
MIVNRKLLSQPKMTTDNTQGFNYILPRKLTKGQKITKIAG